MFCYIYRDKHAIIIILNETFFDNLVSWWEILGTSKQEILGICEEILGLYQIKKVRLAIMLLCSDLDVHVEDSEDMNVMLVRTIILVT